MKESFISVQIEEEDLIAFENFCKSVGLTVSDALILYIKTVNRLQKIPFDITTE